MLALLNFLSKTALKAKISPTNLLLGQSPEPCCWLFRRGAASSILPLLGEGSSPQAHTPRIRPTLPGQPRGNYCSEPQPLFSACSKSQLCCSREGDKTVCHFSGPFFKHVKDEAFVPAEATPNLTESGKGPVHLQQQSPPPENTEAHQSLSNGASAPGHTSPAGDGAAPLTSVHEAQQRAVRRSHQVDQAGLAVADGVRLCSGKERSGGQSCSASTHAAPCTPEGRKRRAGLRRAEGGSKQRLNLPERSWEQRLLAA